MRHHPNGEGNFVVKQFFFTTFQRNFKQNKECDKIPLSDCINRIKLCLVQFVIIAQVVEQLQFLMKFDREKREGEYLLG